MKPGESVSSTVAEQALLPKRFLNAFCHNSYSSNTVISAVLSDYSKLMKGADIQLGISLKAPCEANWVRKKHQVRVIIRKGRSQTSSGLASLGFVLHWDPVGFGGTRKKHPDLNYDLRASYAAHLLLNSAKEKKTQQITSQSIAYSGTLECNIGSTAANYQDISTFTETNQAIKMLFFFETRECPRKSQQGLQRVLTKDVESLSGEDTQGYVCLRSPTQLQVAVQALWCTANPALDPEVQAVYAQFIGRVACSPRTSTAGVWQDHVTRCTSRCKIISSYHKKNIFLQATLALLLVSTQHQCLLQQHLWCQARVFGRSVTQSRDREVQIFFPVFSKEKVILLEVAASAQHCGLATLTRIDSGPVESSKNRAKDFVREAIYTSAQLFCTISVCQMRVPLFTSMSHASYSEKGDNKNKVKEKKVQRKAEWCNVTLGCWHPHAWQHLQEPVMYRTGLQSTYKKATVPRSLGNPLSRFCRDSWIQLVLSASLQYSLTTQSPSKEHKADCFSPANSHPRLRKLISCCAASLSCSWDSTGAALKGLKTQARLGLGPSCTHASSQPPHSFQNIGKRLRERTLILEEYTLKSLIHRIIPKSQYLMSLNHKKVLMINLLIRELHTHGRSSDVDPNQDFASWKHLKFKRKLQITKPAQVSRHIVGQTSISTISHGNEVGGYKQSFLSPFVYVSACQRSASDCLCTLLLLLPHPVYRSATLPSPPRCSAELPIALQDVLVTSTCAASLEPNVSSLSYSALCPGTGPLAAWLGQNQQLKQRVALGAAFPAADGSSKKTRTVKEKNQRKWNAENEERGIFDPDPLKLSITEPCPCIEANPGRTECESSCTFPVGLAGVPALQRQLTAQRCHQTEVEAAMAPTARPEGPVTQDTKKVLHAFIHLRTYINPLSVLSLNSALGIELCVPSSAPRLESSVLPNLPSPVATSQDGTTLADKLLQ
ncbi:hypothetical protein EK904_009922 [Melospiza melodia maxima]|nr:hypothetical protein EK904_009922 [Melospiza melodia maxima]